MCRKNQHTTARYIPRPRREVLDRARLRRDAVRRRVVVIATALLQATPTPMTDDVTTTATLDSEV